MKTLLLCIDFSDVTERLLQQAIALAGDTDRVALLHVAPPNPDFVGYESDPKALRDQWAKTFHREHQQLIDCAETLTGERSGAEILPLVVQGVTGEKILQHAESLEASIILMGTHGHGGLYHLLTGSTSQYVLHHTDIPVLLVPAKSKT